MIYIYFVMLPVYERTNSGETAWQAGMVACLGSGLIEFFGAFVAEPVRRRTPRAALLSTLAGIAIGFISMKFALEIYQRPLVGMLPLAIILITYFSRVGFPLGLPGGFVAILLRHALRLGAAQRAAGVAGRTGDERRGRQDRLGRARSATVRSSPASRSGACCRRSPTTRRNGPDICR